MLRAARVELVVMGGLIERVVVWLHLHGYPHCVPCLAKAIQRDQEPVHEACIELDVREFVNFRDDRECRCSCRTRHTRLRQRSTYLMRADSASITKYFGNILG